jgi:predicted metal-dependent phosphoesterase TrpH
MVARLNALGAALDPDAVLAQAAGGSIGRPHVARAMVAAGLVPSTRQAFADWIGEGQPAYVPKGAISPVRAVELIRAAGGAAVLAHPTWGGVDTAMLDAMCTAGLAGVEAPRQEYEPEAAQTWHGVALARGLLLTCGSDFHGAAQSATMGCHRTPVQMADELRSRAGGEVRQW